jgi:hypothetical protein
MRIQRPSGWFMQSNMLEVESKAIVRTRFEKEQSRDLIRHLRREFFLHGVTWARTWLGLREPSLTVSQRIATPGAPVKHLEDQIKAIK